MAFVILSHRTLASARTRTISVRLFFGLLALALLAVLALGFTAGMAMGSRSGALPPVLQQTAAVSAEPEKPEAFEVDPSWLSLAPPESRVLINRFGELSGRIVQLELEATELAGRIDSVKEFEERMRVDEAEHKSGRMAKTPPGAPAGGPWLKPVDTLEDDAGVREISRPLTDDWAGADVPMSGELSRMGEDVERLGRLLSRLDRMMNAINLAHMSFPGRAPVTDVPVASSFGNRIDPLRFTRAFHSGVDYTAPKGTPIYASGGGKVLFAGYRSQYGNTVEIEHGAGLVTRYAHASKLLVKTGQVVMPGQMIAKIGATGRTTGAHLHFEILKDGRFVNPSAYLARF